METDFSRAENTIILSDIHLADAEPPHPKNRYWKLFKRPEHFIDQAFKNLLEHLRKAAGSPIELVFNGDIFDFDSVMAIPERASFHVSLLERRRGLAAEDEKSKFKISLILGHHPVWAGALRDFIVAGNRVVFIIGNHDMELHWPSVRQTIVEHLELPQEFQASIRFCEWFYISNCDTLIEHGNQYDAYCLCSNPINPLIRKGSRIFVRLPFGNLAGKYMSNAMGFMNPHVPSSFIKSSAFEYIVFFYRYVMRTQPFLIWTWFWGACVTLVYSLAEGFLPAMTDPLTIDDRVGDIAARSNATPGMVWSLKELQVHPAIFNPIKILRELWLDRAVLLGLILFGSFQFFSFLNVFVNVSYWWFVIPVLLLMPLFIFYARSVESEIDKMEKAAFHRVPLASKIARVNRVVQGHTHHEMHTYVDGVDYLNTGTWSPAYHDVECTRPYGRKCFAWIKPDPQLSGGKRIAELCEWKDPGIEVIGRG